MVFNILGLGLILGLGILRPELIEDALPVKYAFWGCVQNAYSSGRLLYLV